MTDAIARNRRTMFVVALLLADAIVISLALQAANYLRFQVLPLSGPLLRAPRGGMTQVTLLAIVAFLPVLWAVGLYEMRRGWGRLDLMFCVLVASGSGAMGFLALSYLLKQFWYSRLMVWLFAVLSWGGLIGMRLLVKRALLACFRRGLGVLRLVIVGESPVGRSLAAKIQANPHCGLRMVGHLLPSGGAAGGGEGGIDRLEEAFASLRGARPHVCLFAEPIHDREEMTYLLAKCQEEGIGVWLGTDLHQRFSPRMELREVESVPVIEVGSLRLATWERLMKRLMDIVGAALLSALTAPFMLYAALRIRREIGFPIIFRQVRVGYQGQPFTILKLRAKGPDTQARIPFCDFLRGYSLDELPQLWNVLGGEMSLVGPRPETPERVRHYNPWNRRRLQVKPGITGLAQIAGVRGEHDFDTKSRFDVRYLENQSLLLDLAILLRTPLVVLRRRLEFRAPRVRARVGGASKAGPAPVAEVAPRPVRYRSRTSRRVPGESRGDRPPC